MWEHCMSSQPQLRPCVGVCAPPSTHLRNASACLQCFLIVCVCVCALPCMLLLQD